MVSPWVLPGWVNRLAATCKTHHCRRLNHLPEAGAMDGESTLWLLGGGALLALIGGVGGTLRGRAPLAWHAHVPWNGLAFGGVAAALMAAVHLFNLLR